MTPTLHPIFSPRARRATPQAFTLLELMIVIGVLAILMSLLLPTIGKARYQGRQVVCASQLKQIYQASTAWQFRQGNDVKDFDAAGWRAKLASYLNPKVYLCPEALAMAAIDPTASGAGSGAAGTNGGAGGSGDPGSNGDTGSVSKGTLTPTLAVHIVNTNYDIPCVPGPWVLLQDVTGNSYTLNFEDQATPAENGGDHSYNNVKLKFTDNGDGTVTVTVLASYGGYTSNLIDASTNKTLMTNIGENPGSVNVGKTVVLTGDPTNSGGGGGTDGSGTTGTPGSPIVVSGLGVSGGPPSNYGMNQDIGLVYGKADKVFAMDYSKTTVFVSDDWQNAGYLNSQGLPIFARHLNKANVCWADGHVEMTPVTKTQLNPSFLPNRATYWDPK